MFYFILNETEWMNEIFDFNLKLMNAFFLYLHIFYPFIILINDEEKRITTPHCSRNAPHS